MKDFLAAAEEAAEAAGSLIRQNLRKAKEVHYKSAINLVTTIDRRAEEMIVGQLLKNFPGHSVLAEEETAIGARTPIAQRTTSLRWTPQSLHRPLP